MFEFVILTSGTYTLWRIGVGFACECERCVVMLSSSRRVTVWWVSFDKAHSPARLRQIPLKRRASSSICHLNCQSVEFRCYSLFTTFRSINSCPEKWCARIGKRHTIGTFNKHQFTLSTNWPSSNNANGVLKHCHKWQAVRSMNNWIQHSSSKHQIVLWHLNIHYKSRQHSVLKAMHSQWYWDDCHCVNAWLCEHRVWVIVLEWARREKQ